MKRLTVHVSGAKASMEDRKNKAGLLVKVPVIKNTLAFEVSDENDVSRILEEIKESGLKPTKHYLSNILK